MVTQLEGSKAIYIDVNVRLDKENFRLEAVVDNTAFVADIAVQVVDRAVHKITV